MHPERSRLSSAYTQTIKRVLLGNACVFAVGLALALGSSAAMAKPSKHHGGDEAEHVKKAPFGQLPKGPLEIFVSINQQKLHLYAGGVHVEDEPVATGVPGHLTPMGVFSVIERDRYHHSNIYDNAPMPFMERITWSGVALHEGVGLGHQASHGCIRMPHDFAARLWTLRTMGMRVIIARPELKPTEFADSHLFVHKDKPIAAVQPTHPVQTAQSIVPGTKTDAGDTLTGRAATDTPAAPAQQIDPPATAQTTLPATPATTPATATTTPGSAPATPSIAQAANSAASAVTASPEPKPEVAATPAETSKPAAPTEVTPATPAAASAAPAQPAAPANTTPAAAAATTTAPAAAPTSAPQAETAAVPPANLTAPVDATPPDVPLPPAKPAKFAESGTGGPIAIFVSRREHRIYVRQNMTPLFDAPVTIAEPDQPLGTHVFTAVEYLAADHSAFRWTLTSLPAEAARVVHEAKRNTNGRRHHEEVEYIAPASTEPPATAQQALARIDIPQDAIEQISQLIVPGSSLVVSDQGLGPETGRGTDFIVVTH